MSVLALAVGAPVLAGSAVSTAVERSSVGTVKAWKACITETVRVTGFAIARGERRLALPQSGYRISDVLVREGDTVATNQDLVRAIPIEAGTAGTVTLRAPAAGLVTQLAAVVGDMTGGATAAGQPLVSIATESGVDLVVDVPSPYAARIRKGAGAHVHGIDGSEVSGIVRDPVSTVNPATQVGQARVAVDTASHLRPGQFASARIDVERECKITIPQAAVTLKDGVASVQVVGRARLEKRTILTGLSDDTDVQVRDGLAEGEVVVASAGSGVEITGAGDAGDVPGAPAKP